MLQLTHRDHSRHVIILLYSTGSVDLVTRHAAMKIPRRITGGTRSSAGGFCQPLPSLGTWGWVGVCEGAALGAWISVGRGMGVLGWRVADRGMCGWLSVLCRAQSLG